MGQRLAPESTFARKPSFSIVEHYYLDLASAQRTTAQALHFPS